MKLADKGEKIARSQEKIKALLDERQGEGRLAEMFSSLNVDGGKVDVNGMEWTGKVATSCKVISAGKDGADLSDDDRDVLKILTSRNETSRIVHRDR